MLKLSQIHPRAFAHPSDLRAKEALEKVPFLPPLLQTVAKINVEQKFLKHQMYNSIRLGPRQLPSLWRMVHDVAERFMMPKKPAAYVSSEGGVNAFAFGLDTHSLILTAGLVDLMTDREIEAIIAHEMAHILCQHMLYRSVGMALATRALSTVNPAAKLASAVVGDSFSIVFQVWSRAAEYSADRAALLVLRDPEALVSCFGKLAGVPKRFMSEFDPRQFAEQVEEHDTMASSWTRLLTWNMGLMRSHPEPAKRAAAILEWSESEQYAQILAGRYVTNFDAEASDRIRIEGVRSCPLCGLPVGDGTICGECGLDQDPALQTRCRSGHTASVGWKFCKACGVALEPERPC